MAEKKQASAEMQKYFKLIEKEVQRCYSVAEEARSKGLDPEETTPIPVAKNMAERVVGLISVVAPQIIGTKIPQRIIELEEEYGMLDWRVAFKIAEEVAKEEFCKFEEKKEAMEVGIRIGFSYLTLGIVSAPLEGFIGLELKKRKDGQEYFALQYAGPIRAAGGTAASVSVLLSDYVRVKMGYSAYDPDEKEVNRYNTEVHDYHDRVTNLQYHPSDDELKFLVSHLPVEIDGNPTEKFDVSNYKDLPRIETNKIRGGVALVLAEGLSQKTPKLWKRLAKWGKEFDLEHWNFLADFLKLKEKIHAEHSSKDDDQLAVEKDRENKEKEKKTVKPNNTFIMDLVAGRPILTYPLAAGGFRLRYGRGRTTGFSSSAAHPATLIALNKFIAIGTQLKTERPGKATTITLCDTLEGPIVRLEDGTVLQLKTEKEAKEHFSKIEEILFLGDILFNYGDFSENGQALVPVGYCEEWWALEVVKAINNNVFVQDKNLTSEQIKLEFENVHRSREIFSPQQLQKAAEFLGIEKERLGRLINEPLFNFPEWDEAVKISVKLNVPLHPDYTFYWKLVTGKDLLELKNWFKEGKIKFEENKPVEDKNIKTEKTIKKIILPYDAKNELYLQGKKVLDGLGVAHQVINNENVVISRKEANIFALCLNFKNQQEMENITISVENVTDKDGLEIIGTLCNIKINDKAGTFIGARMGRPEKAKMRTMTGSPQVMFPVGEEGGRMRSFQAAIESGKIRSAFPIFYCHQCQKENIYPSCEECNGKCTKKYHCRFCGDLDKDTCRHGQADTFKNQDLDIKYYFDKAKDRLGEKVHPDLIKGVRGTSNKDHLPEHLAKGILRAKHNIYVNKDGTTRYDCTELPLTHFKPKEIHTSIEKLKKLGYKKDIYGNELVDEDQILEMKAQDIILPGFDSLDESAPKVLTRVTQFIDELLTKFYGLKPFYKLKSKEDLVGHLVVGLAPHISAGLIGRIIGYSETQGLITHPMYHAGMRRDCLTYDTYVPIFDGNNWQNWKMGNFVENLNPEKVVDSYGTKIKKLQNYFTLGLNKDNHKIEIISIDEVSKHQASATINIIAENGRQIETTQDHIFYVKNGERIIEKKALHLTEDDLLIIPHDFSFIESKEKRSLFVPDKYFKDDLMISGINSLMRKKIHADRINFCKKYNLKDYELKNYLERKNWPKEIVKRVLSIIPKKSYVSIKRDNVKVPASIKLTKDVFWLMGLYIAEGFSRQNVSSKGFYQVSFSATEDYIREKVIRVCRVYFNLKPSRITNEAIIFSSKLFYLFFTNFFPCGSSAYEKKIPPCFLNLNLKKLKYLLQGYFDGDGSTDINELRVSCDTVSKQLIEDLYFVLSRYGIYFRKYESTREPGKPLKEFYLRKNKTIPKFTSTKITIPCDYCKTFAEKIGFSLPRKQKVLLKNVKSRKIRGTKVKHDRHFTYLKVKSLQKSKENKVTYCLNVNKTHNFIANNFIVHNCDGDEAGVMLLMDALLNFSRQYLPERRGAKTMDACLVLTSILYPSEVDDQVHGIDVMWKYPLELYEAALEMKNPWEVKYGPENKKILQLNDRLNTPLQYEQFGFTHHVNNFNKGVQCSAYKTLPSMEEKLTGQMDIAQKVRAVDMDDVAKLVIQKHFLKDIKVNLRKFSMQQFRCVKCNAKFRRPPLNGKCSECQGKLIFTISEGSAIKYLGHSLKLADKYNFSPYLKQTLELLKVNADKVFGKEKEKQVGLGDFGG